MALRHMLSRVVNCNYPLPYINPLGLISPVILYNSGKTNGVVKLVIGLKKLTLLTRGSCRSKDGVVNSRQSIM